MLGNGSSPAHPGAMMEEQDPIKFFFFFFNLPVANLLEQGCCCPLSIVFGAGMLSELELSFLFYPRMVMV